MVTDWGEGAHAGPRGTEAADLTKPDLIQRTFHAKATVFEILYATFTIDGEEYQFGPRHYLIGDWVLEFDFEGTLYLHDMSINTEDDVSFSGT